jgi:hypothetical protein
MWLKPRSLSQFVSDIGKRSLAKQDMVEIYIERIRNHSGEKEEVRYDANEAQQITTESLRCS